MSWPTDEELANGSEISDIPELSDAKSIYSSSGVQVRLVDGDVPPASRMQIAHLAYVAQRAMPKFKTGYDGTVNQDDQRLYVMCSANKAIGLVLTALQGRFWDVAWGSNGSVCLRSETPILERRATIARVWISTNNRNKGFGCKLLECSLSHLNLPAIDAGWEFPFTESGSRLVRHYCPQRFLACCDNWTIIENTTPCGERVGEI